MLRLLGIKESELEIGAEMQADVTIDEFKQALGPEM